MFFSVWIFTIFISSTIVYLPFSLLSSLRNSRASQTNCSWLSLFFHIFTSFSFCTACQPKGQVNQNRQGVFSLLTEPRTKGSISVLDSEVGVGKKDEGKGWGWTYWDSMNKSVFKALPLPQHEEASGKACEGLCSGTQIKKSRKEGAWVMNVNMWMSMTGHRSWVLTTVPIRHCCAWAVH